MAENQNKGQDSNSFEEPENVDLLTEDWEFNVIIDKIACSILPDELKRMKNLARGANGLGRAVLEKVIDAADLFQILRDRTLLDKYNYLHLQSLLWTIGRRDLCRFLSEHAQKDRSKPLHFFPPEPEPENGYIYLKIHIDGTDRSKLGVENLRYLVSRLLFCPIEYVIFVGFEPSSSIIITFMVPEESTALLQSLTPEDRGLLKALKVDYIFIGDQEISITGEEYKPPVSRSEMNAVTTVLREKKRIERELEKVQAVSIKQSKELKRERRNVALLLNTNKNSCIFLSACLYNLAPKPSLIDSLEKQSALAYFRHSLHNFLQKYPDEEDEIYVLLEAKEVVTRKFEREIWQRYATSQEMTYAVFLKSKEMDNLVNMEDLHVTYSNKTPLPTPRQPYPWQNGSGINLYQTILEMPVIQTPNISLGQNHVQPTQSTQAYMDPHRYFAKTRNVPHLFQYENLEQPQYQKYPSQTYQETPTKPVNRTSEVIGGKKPQTIHPLSMPTSGVSPPEMPLPATIPPVHPKKIPDSGLAKLSAGTKDPFSQFMEQLSLKLNDVQREHLLKDNRRKSEILKNIQNHQELFFQNLITCETKPSSATFDPVNFVLEKIASLEERQLFNDAMQMYQDFCKRMEVLNQQRIEV